MTGTGSQTGEGLGAAIKKGIGMVHGSGEAIRGNFNAAVDSATGDRESAQRQQNIASRGVDEFEHGHYHGTGAGVTPVDTDRERINRVSQGESATVGSTNYGPHGTNVGNKLDPRFDSDLDNRGSTNIGPHSTNAGNRVDPRVDDGYPTAQYDGTPERGDLSNSSGSNRRNNDRPTAHPEPSERVIDFPPPPGCKLRIDYSKDQVSALCTPLWTLASGVIAADAIFRMGREQLDSQDRVKRQIRAESKHARCSSADADITRADTFKMPKRSGTDPHATRANTISTARRSGTDAHVARADPVSAPSRSDRELQVVLNELFSSPQSRDSQDERQVFPRLNKPRNNSVSTTSSNMDPNFLTEASTTAEVEKGEQSPQPPAV